LQIEQEMLRFFIRHLPKLTQDLYNILAVISASAVIAKLFDDPKQKNELLRKILNNLMGELERDIKRMVEVRTTGGRYKKKERGPLPEIHEGSLNRF